MLLHLRMHIQWSFKKFDDLSPYEVYDLLRLRSQVFVVEQACIFLDVDDKDQASYHLLGYHQNKLIAYTRIVPPGIIYTEASIGRVVTSPAARALGVGRLLMQTSIEKLYQLYSDVTIKIGAQLYLKKFYESFGFIQTGEGYIEDNIPHIHMLKGPS